MEQVEASAQEREALVAGNTRFALELYRRVSSRAPNLFFSPHNISSALALACAGARGETQAQMARVLASDLPPERLHAVWGGLLAARPPAVRRLPGVTPFVLEAATALWKQRGYPIHPEYLDLVRSRYGSEILEADFAGAPEDARGASKEWVRERTRGRIAKILGPEDVESLTRLLIASATYFKAAWLKPFVPQSTVDDRFRLADGRTAPVRMMRNSSSFLYLEERGLQAMELHYSSGAVSMIVLLPSEPDGIGSLERSLTPETLARIAGGLTSREVRLELPKFTIRWRDGLSADLSAMGMTDAFSSGRADFSGISEEEGSFLGKVLHEAWVQVDEEGTEATAATVFADLGSPLHPPKPVVFRADRPFLFLIRECRSGSILFLGRFADPRG